MSKYSQTAPFAVLFFSAQRTRATTIERMAHTMRNRKSDLQNCRFHIYIIGDATYYKYGSSKHVGSILLDRKDVQDKLGEENRQIVIDDRPSLAVGQMLSKTTRHRKFENILIAIVEMSQDDDDTYQCNIKYILSPKAIENYLEALKYYDRMHTRHIYYDNTRSPIDSLKIFEKLEREGAFG